MTRFAFRQVDYRDLNKFLSDDGIFSKNHKPIQKCHQTSYKQLVERRGTSLFEMPGNRVINDFVSFYLSPISSFTYTIHQGNVPVTDPAGNELGMSKMDDRVFIVCNIDRVVSNISDCYYSNYALNSKALSPEIFDNVSEIEENVSGEVCDDPPRTAERQEIGNKGVRKVVRSNINIKNKKCKEKRMAEILV